METIKLIKDWKYFWDVDSLVEIPHGLIGIFIAWPFTLLGAIEVDIYNLLKKAFR